MSLLSILNMIHCSSGHSAYCWTLLILFHHLSGTKGFIIFCPCPPRIQYSATSCNLKLTYKRPSGKTTGVIDNIKEGSAPFRCARKQCKLACIILGPRMECFHYYWFVLVVAQYIVHCYIYHSAVYQLLCTYCTGLPFPHSQSCSSSCHCI